MIESYLLDTYVLKKLEKGPLKKKDILKSIKVSKEFLDTSLQRLLKNSFIETENYNNIEYFKIRRIV